MMFRREVFYFKIRLPSKMFFSDIMPAPVIFLIMPVSLDEMESNKEDAFPAVLKNHFKCHCEEQRDEAI